MTFFAKNGVEIDFASIEGLRTITSHLGKPLVKMINGSGHPDEKHNVKLLNIARLLKTAFTQDTETLEMLCARNRTLHFP